MQFPFFNFSYCVILLFDHKEYLQSFVAESSMPTDILSFKMMVVLMPTNTAGRDYNVQLSHVLNNVARVSLLCISLSLSDNQLHR